MVTSTALDRAPVAEREVRLRLPDTLLATLVPLTGDLPIGPEQRLDG